MPNYRLNYFNIHGRGEISRLLFTVAKVKFEDVRHDFESKEKLAPPFGQLPVLEVDGKRLAQSTTIARYLANQFGMAGKDAWEKAQIDMYVDFTCDVFEATLPSIFPPDEAKSQAFINERGPKLFGYLEGILAKSKTKYLVSDKLSWADVALMDVCQWLERHKLVPAGNFPSINAHQKKVESIKEIAAYLKVRKPMPH